MVFEEISADEDEIWKIKEILIDEWNETKYGERPTIALITEYKGVNVRDEGDFIFIYESSFTESQVDFPYNFVDRSVVVTFDIRHYNEFPEDGRKRLNQLKNGLLDILYRKRKSLLGYNTHLVIQSRNDLSDKLNNLYRYIFLVRYTRHAIALEENEVIS